MLGGDLGGFPNGRRLARRRHRHRLEHARATAGFLKGVRLPNKRRTTCSATASTRTTCRSSATSRTSQPRTRATRTRRRREPGADAAGRPAAGPLPRPRDAQHGSSSAAAAVVAAGVGAAPRRRLPRLVLRRAPAPLAGAPAAERLRGRLLAGASTAALVARAPGAASAASPKDAQRATTLLGLAYQQRARETGDPTYYPKSEGVLRRALALAPQRPARRRAASARSRSPATASARRSRSAAQARALSPVRPPAPTA